MNITPHKVSREHSVEPLHQVLLSFGKGLWQWPLLKARPLPLPVITEAMLIQPQDDMALQHRVKELTIKQVATMLRMQQEDSEEIAMLGSLESLVLAGEISFQDFIGRAQNLFPKAMANMDVALRMKVASLML